MLYVSEKDYYQVYLSSMLASYDRDILATLYQPIIGAQAMALYFTLWSEAKRQEWVEVATHATLCKQMNLHCMDLQEARKKLEGIGLLQTFYQQKEQQGASYIYCVYAPKSPEDFFSSILMKGSLIRVLGEKAVRRLAAFYRNREPNLIGYQEVTCSYKDCYGLDDPSILKGNQIVSKRGRKNNKIRNEFEVAKFLDRMEEEYHLRRQVFNDALLTEIARIGLLFGFDESMMARLTYYVYHAETKTIDEHELYEIATKEANTPLFLRKGDDQGHMVYQEKDAFTAALNEMESLSPLEFLQAKQNYTSVAPSDVAILNDLSAKYGLKNGVINALIAYSLEKNDMKLPRAYLEKIASTFARKKIQNALQAQNALQPRKIYERKEDKRNGPVISSQPEDDIRAADLLKMLEED